MKNILRRSVKFVAWGIVVGAAVLFFRVWTAPGTCLDLGGSFNYETWQCNDQINQFVAVHFYELKSFWLLVVSFGAAYSLQRGWRGAIQQSVQPDRREDAAPG
ncbi:hypothetical protein HNQ60_001216 [Povalibacter uvarum]|uniref:Uncharacterized protein n=1 Tax=Povalibacter uvarum TaxID=732238 RepID=A0A841HJ86_9GAMM|nr:hypothetical protein [Povalibacter uvarum]